MAGVGREDLTPDRSAGDLLPLTPYSEDARVADRRFFTARQNARHAKLTRCCWVMDALHPDAGAAARRAGCSTPARPQGKPRFSPNHLHAIVI